MKIISWNCRGLGNPFTVRALKDVISSHQPQVIGLIETKKRVASWDRLRVQLGFLNCFAVDRVGLAGGLAVLWKEGIDLSIRNYSSYHIDMNMMQERAFWLTLFYGHPEVGKRRDSWKLLGDLHSSNQGPWLVTGDFNEILLGKETSSGRDRDLSRMRRFRASVDQCGLVDMGFQGYPFTFSNRRKFPFETKARLDRALANSDWMTLFPRAVVQHGEAISSDHCPIIINLNPMKAKKRGQQFRYEVMWHQHDNFKEVLGDIWNSAQSSSKPLEETLRICATELASWNKRSYGNVQKEIRRLKQELGHVRQQRRTEEMAIKENDLTNQIDLWLEREEVLWKQRSKVHWLREGDKNSAFFHAKASQRRKNNRIESLISETSDRVISQDGMLTIVEDYFVNIFHPETESGYVNWDAELDIIEPKVTDEMNCTLVTPVDAEEVRQALFQMNPYKAPGPDGFPAAFFQKNWQLVGSAVCRSVLQILNHGLISSGLNETNIVLIPKCKNATKVSDYRPISLCNVIMRLASKVLANRLQLMLPHIISESQCAFIRGRLISDNILIAHELAHYIKTRQGKFNGLMSMKLDMCKAFDRIEWSFLEKMLLKLGFDSRWVAIVIKIVGTVTYRVKVNDAYSSTIKPGRGIRQGDPLSPYLFNICTEWLSEILKKQALGIRIGQTGPCISHLFFADDSIVFCKASLEDATKVKTALQKYQRISGQMVSLTKSELVFGRNVNENTRREICRMLEIHKVEKHSKYLGLSMVIGLNKRAIFRAIEDKSYNKISDWKAKLLSSAGKEVLIKSVLQAFPQYAMSCYFLPLTLCDKLESSMLKFWWSSNGSDMPIHWVKREILFKGKDLGGLGLRHPRLVNKALLLKQLWRLFTDPALLISKVYKARYFRNSNLVDASLGYRPSHAWRGLLKVLELFREGIGQYREARTPFWDGSDPQSFSVKSAYELAVQVDQRSTPHVGESSNPSIMRCFWRKLWKMKLPGKIKIFVWRLFYDSLPDAYNLRKRGCDINLECIFCGWKLENSSHLFKDCWRSKVMWQELGLESKLMEVDGGGITDWLFFCFQRCNLDELRMFLCGLWWLWYSRNVVRKGTLEGDLSALAFKVKTYLIQLDSSLSRKHSRDYLFPQEDFDSTNTYIYCDASWTSRTESAGLSAVLVISGVVHRVLADGRRLVSSVQEAEGQAIVLGWELAASEGLREVTLLSDSAENIGALRMGRLKGGFRTNWLSYSLMLLSVNPLWKFAHCSRDGNRLADLLANYARQHHWSWKLPSAIPFIPSFSALCS